jgi:hypothetical protein
MLFLAAAISAGSYGPSRLGHNLLLMRYTYLACANYEKPL